MNSDNIFNFTQPDPDAEAPAPSIDDVYTGADEDTSDIETPAYIETEYNDDAIQTLEWNIHIRRRPGMYIGKLGDGTHIEDGIYVLLKEVIDNSIDGAGALSLIQIRRCRRRG